MTHDGTPDNVIQFQRSSVLPKPEARRSHCECAQVAVDHHRRLVECRSCGRAIDPFEFLVAAARREVRWISEAEARRAEVTKLNAEIDELKRQRASLRQQVKRVKAAAE